MVGRVLGACLISGKFGDYTSQAVTTQMALQRPVALVKVARRYVAGTIPTFSRVGSHIVFLFYRCYNRKHPRACLNIRRIPTLAAHGYVRRRRVACTRLQTLVRDLCAFGVTLMRCIDSPQTVQMFLRPSCKFRSVYQEQMPPGRTVDRFCGRGKERRPAGQNCLFTIPSAGLVI